MAKKLRHNEIKSFREELLIRQGGRDPITGLQIKDAVLDHDHVSGRVRCVLQRKSIHSRVRYGTRTNALYGL